MDKRLLNSIGLSHKRIIVLLLFFVLVVLSLMIGASSSMSVAALLRGDSLAWKILLHSRLPRTVAIVLSAAGLSVAGLIMQAISRNKFMSPATSGTMDAAALGLLIAFVFLGEQSSPIQTLFAFSFALVSTLLFTSVVNKLKIKEAVYIPLIGMMYGGLISAVTATIAYQFDVSQLLARINIGNFARVGEFAIIYMVIPPIVFAVLYSAKFSIIGMGEDFSKNLGVNYNRVVFTGLAIIALISASTFVAVGPLPFIGLIIPNMTASYYGDNIKRSIIDIMFFGADFVLVCDIISRLIAHPFEISVSLTISVVGGVIFMIYLIRGLQGAKARKALS